MFPQKIFLFILALMCVTNSAIAIGVFDDNGNFFYLISKDSPDINISIQNTAEPINVRRAILKINDESFTEDINEQILPARNSEFKLKYDNFNIGKNIEQNDDVFFTLEIINSNNENVSPRGDPTSFELVFDNILPQINLPIPESVITLDENDREIDFSFSEKIKSYTIKLNSQNVISEEFNSDFEREFKNIVNFNFQNVNLLEGDNEIIVEFEDLAGNKNSERFIVKFRDSDLTLKLLTIRDDDELEYYYDVNFLDFFNKTIYTKRTEFDLKVETSKSSNCFISKNLVSFETFNNVNNKIPMTTSDNRNHVINIDTTSVDKIWLACQNVQFIDDIVYLNDILGHNEDLIKIRKYQNQTLRINNVLPEGKVTGIPFNMFVETNSRAVCDFSIGSINKQIFGSTNRVDHLATEINLPDGEYTLDINCFDFVYNLDSSKETLIVDSKDGVLVTSFSPEFFSKSTGKMSLTLSEDALCRFSEKPEKISEFPNIGKNTSGIGLSREINVGPFVEGENFVYIYCRRDNEVFDNTLKVIYDTKGPRIENLSFVNKGIKSKYIGRLNGFEISFDVNSLIPVKEYLVKVFYQNKTLNFTSKNNQILIDQNISGAKKIEVFATNEIDVLSTPTISTILFDLESPSTSIITEGNRIKVTCFDGESECLDIKFGFSQTGIDCIASTTYNLNESVLINDNNFICAKSRDVAGNEDFKQLALTPGFSRNETIKNISVDNENTEEVNNTNEIELDLSSEIDEPEPFKVPGIEEGNNSQSDNSTLIIIVLGILLSFGVLGFFLYKKGYLNNYIEKFRKKKDIAVPVDTQQVKKETNNDKSVKPITAAPIIKDNKPKEVKKTKYDEHLDKLKSFIDENIDKRKDLFSEFDNNTKDNVEGYEDTLIKKKKSKKKEVNSREEFDEFYNNSKKVSNLNLESNIEDDAENFENYHKKNRKKESDKKD